MRHVGARVGEILLSGLADREAARERGSDACVCDEVDVWLDSVEQSYGTSHQHIKTQYEKDVTQLKTMQVHDTCSDTKCMFKQGQYTSGAGVATSDGAQFFIKAASVAAAIVGDDPVGDAVDAATS